MDIVEIQLKLREIENMVNLLNNEIEKSKPKPEEQVKEKFDNITKLADKEHIYLASIANAPVEIRKLFIRLLSYLGLMDSDNQFEILLYLCRLSFGCGLNEQSYEIYRWGLAFEKSEFENACTQLQEYKYTFLVEAFVLINLSGKATDEILSIVCNVAEIMGCDSEEIGVIAQFAKARLICNIDIVKDIPVPTKHGAVEKSIRSGKFGDYLDDEWIASQRIICGKLYTDRNVKKSTSIASNSLSIPIFLHRSVIGDENQNRDYETEHPCTIKFKISAGSAVHKGDLLISYDEVISSTGSSVNREIVAPENGVVYFVNRSVKGKVKECNDMYLYVYLVSYYDDYDKFWSWYKSIQ
jgi:hypothetical protein